MNDVPIFIFAAYLYIVETKFLNFCYTVVTTVVPVFVIIFTYNERT